MNIGPTPTRRLPSTRSPHPAQRLPSPSRHFPSIGGYIHLDGRLFHSSSRHFQPTIHFTSFIVFFNCPSRAIGRRIDSADIPTGGLITSSGGLFQPTIQADHSRQTACLRRPRSHQPLSTIPVAPTRRTMPPCCVRPRLVLAPLARRGVPLHAVPLRSVPEYRHAPSAGTYGANELASLVLEATACGR